MAKIVGPKRLMEYKRLRRNTRAKINRVKRNFGIDLSSEVDIPDVESFESVKQFNEFRRQQQSFTNRNNLNYQFRKNPYGVVASKSKLDEVDRITKEAQRMARRYQEQLGQGPNARRQKILKDPHVAGVRIPDDFDFNEIKSPKGLDVRIERMRKQSDIEYYDEKTEQMHENFMELLRKSFNSDADELIEAVRDMSPDDFVEMYFTYKEFDFDRYFYPIDGVLQNDNDDLTEMLNNIQRYYKGDKDLKGF